jgi:hypothetical protein
MPSACWSSNPATVPGVLASRLGIGRTVTVTTPLLICRGGGEGVARARPGSGGLAGQWSHTSECLQNCWNTGRKVVRAVRGVIVQLGSIPFIALSVSLRNNSFPHISGGCPRFAASERKSAQPCERARGHERYAQNVGSRRLAFCCDQCQMQAFSQRTRTFVPQFELSEIMQQHYGRNDPGFRVTTICNGHLRLSNALADISDASGVGNHGNLDVHCFDIRTRINYECDIGKYDG